MNEPYCRCAGCGECSAHRKEPKLESRIEALERERDHNLDSINVGNAIINKQLERIKELEAALDLALEALELPIPGALNGTCAEWDNWRTKRHHAIAKLKEVRPTPQQEADQRAWEWQNQHHIRRQFEDDDFQPGAI